MSSNIFRSPLPYIALLLAHLIWGVNFVVAKVTLTEFPVMSLAFLRFFFAAILMAPFLITHEPKLKKIKSEHLPKLFLAGVFLVTFNITFFYEGLLRTTAIDASVLTMIIPIVSVLGGWWILREKIFLINLMGILLGFFGVITIIVLPQLVTGVLASPMLLGNILIIISAVSFVAGSILSKEALSNYPPIMVTTILFLVGTVTFAIPAGLEYLHNPEWIREVSILGLLGFLFITLLSSVTAHFLLIWGLSKISVTQVSLFTYLEPAVAATLATLFLAERISYSFIVGTCLIILGVYWGTLGKEHHHHIHHRGHRA